MWAEHSNGVRGRGKRLPAFEHRKGNKKLKIVELPDGWYGRAITIKGFHRTGVKKKHASSVKTSASRNISRFYDAVFLVIPKV